MLKRSFIFFFLLLYQVTSLANTHLASWEQIEKSSKQFFEVQMSCESPLTTGVFQQCHLVINRLNDLQATQSLENLTIIIGGGMPAHHHGLPTEPIINWSQSSKTYPIKGLKFSMPGKWVLHFYINDKDHNIKDVATFNFNI